MEKELLLKYIEGDCTDSEKVEITKWLDSDSENMKEFLVLRKLHDITIWQSIPVSKSKQHFNKKVFSLPWKPIYTEVIKIAAVLIFALLISQVFFQKSIENPIVMQTLHVPEGQRAEIVLADGTNVWLNAKTTLTFPTQFTDECREVRLDGEGFFDVTPNKSSPFIVKTEKFDIKVLGAKFNLMAYSGNKIFELGLLEGSVELLKPNTSKGALLKPNERIFLEGNQLVKSTLTNLNHFLWKEGIISFDDESFPEMINKLELYFDLRIKIENDKILNYKCTGKFRTKDGVEHILQVLQLRNNFSYKIDEKQNIITIK